MDASKKHETTIDPFYDVLICQTLRSGEIVSGGIVIPEGETNVIHGLVLAAGPGVFDSQGRRMENPIKVGDVVIYLKSNSFDFWDGNHKHAAVRANAIVGKVKQQAAS